jgi:molybdenum cofactor biosynthesis enzyme
MDGCIYLTTMGTPVTLMDITSRDTIQRDLYAAGRNPSTVAVAQWFAVGHLPEGNLRETSKLAGTLAASLIATLPDSPELTTGLRKLLESKDCFVRAALAAEQG